MAEARSNIHPINRVWDLLWGPMRIHAMHAGVENGFFDLLAEKALNAKQVAKATKCNERATRMLLDELAALGLLIKRGDKYSATGEAKTFLVRTSPLAMMGTSHFNENLIRSWFNLAEVVKTGKAISRLDETEAGAEFFRHLVSQIFPPSYSAATILTQKVKLPAKGEVRVLDVAAGSAAWSLPFAQKYPNTRITVIDLAPVLEVTREFTDRFGVTDRYEFIAGDLREVDFGRAKFDLVVLGHICHSEGEKWSQKLIAKAGKALKPGGCLAIPDMIPNDQRTGGEFGLLFALQMLLHTTEGDTFTRGQYRNWMTKAGLGSVSFLTREQAGCDIALARKKS